MPGRITLPRENGQLKNAMKGTVHESLTVISSHEEEDTLPRKDGFQKLPGKTQFINI